MSDPTVTTDLEDYAPGSTAYITASGFTAGSTVMFEVDHAIGAGADGIWGTDDDELDTATGEGHTAWYVIDGGEGDLDGLANGVIQTTWFVNPDDSLGATFLLTATGIDVGEDGFAGTADDSLTGEVATDSFTDSGGAYTLNFSAANPADYIPAIPFPADLTAPVGRGDGDPLIPLAEFNDGSVDVKVESLAPQDMALGQIVPFELKISTSGDTAPENGVITVVLGWNTLTTNSGDFGYDARGDDVGYGVIGAFIDTGDGAYTDANNDATVTGFTWTLINDEIVGIFTVSGLDDGDEVVLEAWLVLDDTIPAGIGGNVQSRLIDAATGSDQTINVANSGAITLINGDSITTGNQTVPLLRPGEFFTSDVDLSVTKDDDIDPIVQGETLTYTITAANAGPSVANTVVVYDVLDPNVTFVSASDGGFINTDAGDTIPDGAVQWNVGALAPLDSVVYTVTVTVNEDAPTASATADIINTVTVTTISNDTNSADNTDTEPTDVLSSFVPDPSLSIVKEGQYNDSDAIPGLSAGDTLTYTFDVENTGNVDITGVDINEVSFDLAGDITITAPADVDLSPGEEATFTGVYTLTQADIDATYASADDDVDNVATASGTAPDATTVTSNEDPAQIPLAPEISLLLAKEGAYTDLGLAGLDAGDTLNYTFKVTNTGDVTVTGVDINEVSFDLPGPIAITAPADVDLSPGEEATFTGVYTLTQADIDSLSSDPLIDNVGSATGTAPDGGSVTSNQDPALITLTPEESLAILKDGVYTDVGSDGLNVGDTLNYTFKVTNTGDVTVTGVDINEVSFDLPGPIAITAPADVDLSPGEEATFTGVYTLTQADIDSLSSDPLIDNVGSATGTAPDGGSVTSNEDPALITLTPEESLAILKDGVYTDVGSDGLNVGDTLNYTFKVTNTGDVTVTGVDINEVSFDLPGPIAITAPADVDLSPGEEATFTGVYTLTQADIDSLSSDPLIDNVGSATGTAPDGGSVTSNEDPALITLTPEESLAILKDGVYTDVGSDGLNVGDTLNYTFKVTNTGDVTVTGVDINEVSFDLPGPIAITAPADVDLSPGEEATFTGVYTLTQADIDSLSSDPLIDNVGSATGTAPDGGSVTSNEDPALITLTPEESLAILKDGVYTDVGSDGLNVGDTLNYTFKVTNTGDVTVTGVDINEVSFDLPGPIAITAPADVDLSPGEEATFTGVYTLTQADIDSLSSDPLIDNVGSATGTAPDGGSVTSNQDPALITLTPEESLAILKDGVYTDVGSDGLNVGDTLNYTFKVTNTGDVTVTGVDINEVSFDLPGPIAITAPADVDLSPGEEATFTGVYTLTQADIDSLSSDPLIDNVGSATGTAPDGGSVTSNEDPALITLTPEESLAILKDGVYTDVGSDGLNVGDTLNYTFKVTNTGDVTVTGVDINEVSFDLPGPIAITAPADVDLSPGEEATFTGVYTLTQADIDSLSSDPLIDNVGSATGTAPDGGSVTSNEDPALITLTPEESLAILKDGVYTDVGSDGLNVGDTLNYTFKVTNTGDVTVTGVDINEVSFDLPGPIAITAPADVDLSPGEEATFTGVYTLTQADIDSLSSDPLIDNVGSATGTAPDGGSVTSNEDPALITLTPEESLAILKDGVYTDVGSDGLNVGDTLNYTFKVTNTGDVTVTGVDINEVSFDLPGPIAITAPADVDLSPGEEATFTGVYTLTQADIDATYASADDDVDNVANATGTAPDGGNVTSNNDAAEIPLAATASIDIEKLVSVDGGVTFVDADDPTGPSLVEGVFAPQFKFVVTNTGQVTLSNVSVTDSDFDLNGGVAGTAWDIGTLAVDGQVTLTITEGWEQGQHTDTGTVTAEAPGGDTNDTGDDVTDSDDANYFGTSAAGKILPTGVNCDMYVSGDYQTFAEFYASQTYTYPDGTVETGVIQYNVNKNTINAVNPGVFFYYTGLSNTITGDGSGADVVVEIDQSNNGTSINGLPGNTEWNFAPVANDVKLFVVDDANGNGEIDADESCMQVQLEDTQIVFGDGDDLGDVTVTFTPEDGALYVISVKYDTGTVSGLKLGNARPTVDYTFNTDVGADGTIDETAIGGITLAPKVNGKNKLTLDGTTEGDGAKALSEAELDHVLGQAIAYWAKQGANNDELATLRGAAVSITDLGGLTLAETDDDGISIDDDAAGYGWSLGLGGVAKNKVDLLSAVAHEFGHLLGYDHDEMDGDLAVGERDMPLADAAAAGPLPAFGVEFEELVAIGSNHHGWAVAEQMAA